MIHSLSPLFSNRAAGLSGSGPNVINGYTQTDEHTENDSDNQSEQIALATARAGRL
jgi:hypothetical protein